MSTFHLDIYLSGTKGKPVFRKTNFGFSIGPYTGIASEQDLGKHRVARKWMAPVFGPNILKEQDPVLHRVVDIAVNKMALRGNTPEGLNMIDWCNWIACDLAGILGWGHDFGNLKNEKTSLPLQWFNNVMFWVTVDQAFKQLPLLHPLVYLGLPLSMIRVLRALKAVVRDRVENRKDYKQRDYFTALLQDGKAIPNENLDYLVAHSTSLFIAGVEPNSQLFSSMILFLAQNPDKLKKLTDEIRGMFKRYEDIVDEELTRLPWLSAVIEESLRLHTNAANGQPRISPGATVDGHYIPAGCHVQTAIFTTYHSERYWHKPNSFCPERWLPATDPDHDPAFAKDMREHFRPFSVGNRNCIGQNMAYRQARVLMAKMAWKLDWELVNGDEFDWQRDLRLYATYTRPEYRARFRLSDVAKAAAAEEGEKLIAV
ncbi:isotrichodermin C-15 hydroxylase [Magnaporthiopsis poae ATCC 64411]|uniref:Isotrichodermin C-15 hydroxylase n=1 Tax=Magnaporthiopsis poae (strain ATCC 64411 / 73-15) TaxID=644358 RepID=A0A0C4DMS4_MAGP6|nr:isotrichodermin C-15 hydroxylase [Magnaporthiopsis poae ATCC 64411]